MFLLAPRKMHFMSSYLKTLIVTLSQTGPDHIVSGETRSPCLRQNQKLKFSFTLLRPPAVSGHHQPVSEKCVFIRFRVHPDASTKFLGIWCRFKWHIYLMQEWKSFVLIFRFPERNFLSLFLRHNRRWFYHHKTLNIGSRFSKPRSEKSYKRIFKHFQNGNDDF